MTAEAPPPPSPAPPATPPKSQRLRIAVAFGILAGVVVVYTLTLFLVHYLGKSGPRLPPLELSQYHVDDTVVQVHIDELKTVANRLSVNVQVWPKDSLIDKQYGVLTTDTAVRLYPNNDLGDLQYAKGKAPAQVGTTIEAHGDPNNWPFDTYTTDQISGWVYTGVPYQDAVSARMEVTGSLDGWDASVTRVHDAEDTQNPNSLDNVIITLHRSKAPLIFDLGLCLVLVSLPALALIVAIPMALNLTSFLPPFSTWYAAMLFAIVPLRNFFPGSPPPGSWVDQAIVLWVLIALVVAMCLFVVGWVRQRDRRPPKAS